jgi:hypothetical protein
VLLRPLVITLACLIVVGVQAGCGARRRDAFESAVRLTLQNAARHRGFVTRPERGDRAEALEVPAELFQVVREFVDVGRRRRIASRRS